MRAINMLADIVILSVLWFIGSLPILTIGASTTALMSVSGQMVRKEETRIIADFIKSYKGNFKRSFGCSVILLVIWIAAISYFMRSLPNVVEGAYFTVVFMIILLFETVMVSLYLCGLLVKYDLGAVAVLKNALVFVHAYFKESAQAFGMIVVTFFLVFAFPPLIVLLPGIVGIIASGFLKISIDKYKERLKVIEKIRKEKREESE